MIYFSKYLMLHTSYMRHITLVLLPFILTCPSFLRAQKITLDGSSRQRWSGGIAGRSGENYTFTIDFTGYKNDLAIDSLWISDEFVLLTGSSAKISYRKNGLRLQLTAGISRNEYNNPSYTGKPLPSAHAPCKYKGVALLSYHYKSRQYYYSISRIITHYPQVSYP